METINGLKTSTNIVITKDKLLDSKFSPTTKETLLSLAKKLVEEDEDSKAKSRKNGFHLEDHLTDDIKQNLGALATNGGGDKEEEEISGLILSFSDEEQDNIDRKSLEYGAMANNRVKQGDFKGAVKLYSLAISLNDNDFRFFCNRSFCYEHLKQYKLALADADQAIRLLPFRPKPHFMRGKALIGLRRYEEAEREFKLAEKMDPDCKDYYEEMIKLRNLAFSELGFQREESYIAAQRYGSIQEAIDALLHDSKHQTAERHHHRHQQSSQAGNNSQASSNNNNETNNSNSNNNNRRTRDRRCSASVSRARSKSRYRRSSPLNSSSQHVKSYRSGGGRQKHDIGRSSSLDSFNNNNNNNSNSNNSNYSHNYRGNKTSARPRAPINIFGYKAVWIGNVGPRCKPERLREIFGKYGRITVANIVPESFCAFVCFDNSRSPCAAIYDLYEKVVDGISNGNRCLKFRFAPGKDQDKNYHKTARRKTTDECYFWRTTGCTSGDKCKRLHLAICRGIDFQPWMSKK